MRERGAILAKLFCLWAVISCLTVAPAAAKPTRKKAEGTASMQMHHSHTMMNHGLIMALQGSNLVMLSSMRMSPGVDEITMTHGNQMIVDGKTMVKEMLSGSHMKELHEQGRWSDALMGYTHELGAAFLAVLDDGEKMDLADIGSPEAMKMHHMHIALNHALEMAAEGANLVMLGKMTMARGVDDQSIAHGRKMIADARKLWSEVMDGEAMKALHAAGSKPEAPGQMAYTHKMAKDGEKVITLLEKMDTL
jgi:hypothetical protein